MLNFFYTYLLFGFVISIIMNVTLWVIRKPTLTGWETIATILLWPTVITGIINNYYGYQDNED